MTRLGLPWSLLDTLGGLEVTPLVKNRVIYATGTRHPELAICVRRAGRSPALDVRPAPAQGSRQVRSYPTGFTVPAVVSGSVRTAAVSWKIVPRVSVAK